MATTITAGNATNGAAISSDNTGILELKTGTGAGTTAVTIGTDQSVTFAGAISSSGNQTVTGNLTVNGNTTLGDANTDTILMTAAPSIGGAGLGMGFGFRNRIINGAMAINQRVSSLSTNNTQGYYVDRMWGFSGVSTAVTFSQIGSTGLAGFPNAARVQRTAATTGINNMFTGQIVESNNLQDLQGQTVSISFWARAGANCSASASGLLVYLRTGTTADQGLNALISGWAGAVDQNTTVTLTTSWQRFTVTSFSVPSNAQELTVFFGYAPTGTAGANDWFDITGVQLEKGSTATSFDYRPYGTELALCQRYYYRTTPGAGDRWFGSAQVSSSTTCYADVPFPVPMRSAPSALEQSGTASDYRVWASGAGTVTCSGVPAFYNASTMASTITGTVASGITAGNATTLRASNATAYLGWSAEL